jgi:D-alanyl-D-alanine carboxypeptidase (penicillin-binding protein 5/6)
MALIARYGMQIPIFRQIVRATSYTKERTNKQPAVVWRQQYNKLLIPGPSYYEQATGIKTGYHRRAQHCLIASAENADRSLIAVFFHCPDRKQMFLAAKKLLDRFLSEEKARKVVIEKGTLQLTRLIEGQAAPLPLVAPRECAVAFYPSEKPDIRAVVEWKELSYPIEPGQEVGAVRVYADDQEVDSVPLLASESRSKTWRQSFLSTAQFVHDHRGAVTTLVLCLGIALVVILYLRSRTSRR